MNKPINYFLLMGISSLIVFSFFTSVPSAKAAGNQITLEELGMLQLAAHDFFNVDRCDRINEDCAIEHENRMLDLSTLLVQKTVDCEFEFCPPFSDADIAMGGEPRNRESILIFTVASELGEKYLELREDFGEKKAYAKTLQIYHNKIKDAFEAAFDQQFPDSQPGQIGHIHNLALRSGHDFLPGKVIFNGELVNIFTLTGKKFNAVEKNQPSSPLDGIFDEEFLGIDVCIETGFCINVNLLEADRSFGKQFGLGDDTFDHFMEETSDGQYDSDEDVTMLITELFARGIVSHTYVGGEIIPIETTSLLLAGAQSFSWMIPPVLSLAGFGLFFLKKMKY